MVNGDILFLLGLTNNCMEGNKIWLKNFTVLISKSCEILFVFNQLELLINLDKTGRRGIEPNIIDPIFQMLKFFVGIKTFFLHSFFVI